MATCGPIWAWTCEQDPRLGCSKCVKRAGVLQTLAHAPWQPECCLLLRQRSYFYSWKNGHLGFCKMGTSISFGWDHVVCVVQLWTTAEKPGMSRRETKVITYKYGLETGQLGHSANRDKTNFLEREKWACFLFIPQRVGPHHRDSSKTALRTDNWRQPYSACKATKGIDTTSGVWCGACGG